MGIAMKKFINPSEIVAACISVKGSPKDECKYAESAAKELGFEYRHQESDPSEELGDLDTTIINTNRPTAGLLLWATFSPPEKDVNWFTGQDTRLHTPSFNRFDELMYKLAFRNDKTLIFRDLLATFGKILGKIIHIDNIRKKGKFLLVLDRIRYINDIDMYLMKYIFHYSENLSNFCDKEILKKYLDYFRLYIEKYLGPKINLRNFYNDIVKVRWREQYKNEIMEIQSIFNYKDIKVQFPYYDMELAEFSSKIPFSIANRTIIGTEGFSTKPAKVNKYLLRKAFEGECPRGSLLRKKAVCEAEHLYFNGPLRAKIKSKFLHAEALKDPTFIKLGFDKLAQVFINKSDQYEVGDINYLYRIFNLYALCLYYENLQAIMREG
jgi:asparagine synthase (glutamine-hydrolysing)